MGKALERAAPDQVPSVPEATSILAVIERAARSPEVDVEKMSRLLDMHERITGRQAETAFNGALNLAQAKVGRIGADATNPQTRSKYASYDKLDSILRPIYIEQGFSLSFDTGESPAPEHIRVQCHVSHRDGHTRTYHIDMPADGKGAKGGDVMTKTHAAGSAVSYGMRYLLKMIFNVAVGDTDDDGNAAGADYITDKQAADLRAWATELKGDLPAFLRFMGAESFETILAKDYQKAIAAMQAKADRIAAGGT